MANLALIFATGLTAGGLSCLAVQGGLLATSLSAGADQEKAAVAKRPAAPIAWFLVSKLAAYTVLGGILGWAGSFLQLAPQARAWLQLAVGLFMVVTALRLLDVHPVFRYFAVEPPRALTRWLRARSKRADVGWFAPVLLGALTVLIPCGVTQAMMALAVGSGNAVSGALIMFAFVLGTTPLFFALAYLATKLGARLQKAFWKIAGAVVLILGAVAIYGSLMLFGAPPTLIDFGSRGVGPTSAPVATSASPAPKGAVVAPQNTPDLSNTVAMRVTDQAYSPAVMRAKAGLPINLVIATNNVRGCAGSLVIPALNVQKLLPPNTTTTILLPSQSAGSKVRLTCVMGMYNAEIDVE